MEIIYLYTQINTHICMFMYTYNFLRDLTLHNCGRRLDSLCKAVAFATDAEVGSLQGKQIQEKKM